MVSQPRGKHASRVRDFRIAETAAAIPVVMNQEFAGVAPELGEEIEERLTHLLNRTLSLDPEVGGGDVLVDVIVEVDDVRLRGFGQDRRMGGGDDAEFLPIGQ